MRTLPRLAALCLLLSLASIGCVAGCDRGYSEGTRAGTITQFSHKGIVTKTWEGQMNLGGMRQSEDGKSLVPNTWDFTVLDLDLVPQVQAALQSNEPVTLRYVQWLIMPVFSMGSQYEIVEVKPGMVH